MARYLRDTTLETRDKWIPAWRAPGPSRLSPFLCNCLPPNGPDSIAMFDPESMHGRLPVPDGPGPARRMGQAKRTHADTMVAGPIPVTCPGPATFHLPLSPVPIRNAHPPILLRLRARQNDPSDHQDWVKSTHHTLFHDFLISTYHTVSRRFFYFHQRWLRYCINFLDSHIKRTAGDRQVVISQHMRFHL
jgi:hypothetical protein